MTRPMSLDDLEMLNAEMISLSRAGIPLGPGLLGVTGGLPGRLAEAAEDMGRRLQHGESLARIVADRDAGYPPVYRALVAAGIQSGRLTAALEGMATTLGRLADLRRVVMLSLVYPLIVLTVACVLFGYSILHALPLLQLTMAQDRLGVEQDRVAAAFFQFVDAVGPWVAFLPALVVLGGAFWWWSTGRVTWISAPASDYWLAWLPGARRLMQLGRAATFSEVLGLLVRNRVPLPEAIVMAADTTGNPQMIQDAARLARQVQAGDHSVWQKSAGGLPTLLCWAVCDGQGTRDLPQTLQVMSEGHYRRVKRHAEWLRLLLPIWATLVIGGIPTMLYAGSLFVPWLWVLQALSH